MSVLDDGAAWRGVAAMSDEHVLAVPGDPALRCAQDAPAAVRLRPRRAARPGARQDRRRLAAADRRRTRDAARRRIYKAVPVSYTHLTLPTNREV